MAGTFAGRPLDRGIGGLELQPEIHGGIEEALDRR